MKLYNCFLFALVIAQLANFSVASPVSATGAALQTTHKPAKTAANAGSNPVIDTMQRLGGK